jgi:small subunit ribosomal protein S6
MSTYELTLILKPEMTEEQADSFIDKLGVNVTSRQKWGKRLLVFPIKKNKEGNYILCDLEAETSAMKALNQKLTIDEQVIRYLLIEKQQSN